MPKAGAWQLLGTPQAPAQSHYTPRWQGFSVLPAPVVALRAVRRRCQALPPALVEARVAVSALQAPRPRQPAAQKPPAAFVVLTAALDGWLRPPLLAPPQARPPPRLAPQLAPPLPRPAPQRQPAFAASSCAQAIAPVACWQAYGAGSVAVWPLAVWQATPPPSRQNPTFGPDLSAHGQTHVEQGHT